MRDNCRPTTNFSAALAAARDQHGQSLAETSNQSPTLVVFLRHAGCAFCREALADIAVRRRQIESSGTRIAIVQMSDTAAGTELLGRYGLADLSLFSDPDRALYRAFDLKRGSLWQVLGPKVWWRGFQAAILHRHGAGAIAGDVLQLPGAFVIHNGQIVRSYRHHTSADRPDYAGLACPVPERSKGI